MPLCRAAAYTYGDGHLGTLAQADPFGPPLTRPTRVPALGGVNVAEVACGW
jgi:hypothetical protein